jgi:hypothetical protein
MSLDLDELESKAKAATRGPWKCVAHVESLLLGVQSADGAPISVIAGNRPLTNMRQAIADNAHIAAANPETMLALIAHIRQLEADNKDFLEQIAVQTESVLFKELQEIMKANNALHDENARLKQLVDFADALRAAQRAYMADRGNDQLGRAVADAAKDYYALRSLWGPLMHRMVPQSAMGPRDAV